ncbi:hypothetical protein [Streptomyces cavernicola]|uniref:Sortase n=1 Tax=Streptomyces cavernicola TaxID=3043613 RepID=A0ABT6S8G0_9ACTN|nr:hypothetical protein [Streptomyces sp. B-S-A6]MDI3404388.1 hypothetical protein [Streptomyces sp. B-S-A6]
MRRIVPTLCATTLLTLAPASPASAGDTGVTVDPASAVPGMEVRLTVTGCAGQTGAAKSEAFVADGSLALRDGRRSPLVGEAMIRSTVTPGTYDISVTCDGQEGKAKGSFKVVREKPAEKPGEKPAEKGKTASASPTAPSRAGGGGTASMAAEADDEGPGLRHAVIGGVLVTAAALAVTGRILRRRRRPE